jgi:NtrC-family two-component system sensor histidine kinase KinB
VIGVLLVFNDETETHNLERAREEFSQLIIHDLRSPLTAVTSSVSLLSEIIPPENEFSALIAKTAGSSQRAIRKLLNRVDSLLDISRMKSGQMSLHLEVAQLGPLIDNVCTELEPLAHDLDIVIAPQLPDDQPWLLIDPEKIERVLLNLVDNALKFSPRATPITIHMQVSEEQVCMQVIDGGPGIPESERQSIFDRFVQIQNQSIRHRRGSGLGLNFCKLAIEAHGGRIWIDANPSGGSVFAFTLPLSNVNGPTE